MILDKSLLFSEFQFSHVYFKEITHVMGFNKVMLIKCLAQFSINVNSASDYVFMVRVSREFSGGTFTY